MWVSVYVRMNSKGTVRRKPKRGKEGGDVYGDVGEINGWRTWSSSSSVKGAMSDPGMKAIHELSIVFVRFSFLGTFYNVITLKGMI